MISNSKANHHLFHLSYCNGRRRPSLPNFLCFSSQLPSNQPFHGIAEEISVFHWEKRWYYTHKRPLFSQFPLQLPIITRISITGGNFSFLFTAVERVFMFVFLKFYFRRLRSRPVPAAEVWLEGNIGIVLTTLGLLQVPPICPPRLSHRIFQLQVQVQIRSDLFLCCLISFW